MYGRPGVAALIRMQTTTVSETQVRDRIVAAGNRAAMPGRPYKCGWMNRPAP
jgi:hypothetical protein